MLNKKLTGWFNQHWSQDMGAVDGRDIGFLAAMIKRQSPKQMVEIGCASGLSTAILAQILGQHGPSKLDSFDLAETFYADPTKPVGYLLKDLPAPENVALQIHTGMTSMDVERHLDEPIELCFIDAAHKHPWPLIDTLAVLPLMAPGGVIVHHDLQMSGGKGNYALGPKVLYDQLSDAERLLVHDWVKDDDVAALKQRHIKNNIYGIALPQDKDAFATRIAEGFYVGWDRDGSKGVPEKFAKQFSAFLKEAYPPEVQTAFDIGMTRYNPVPQARRDSFSRRLGRRLRSHMTR